MTPEEIKAHNQKIKEMNRRNNKKLNSFFGSIDKQLTRLIEEDNLQKAQTVKNLK